MMMFLRLLLVALCMMASSAHASGIVDYKDFSSLPVQHDGRVKPVDTLARSLLTSFSGHDTLHGKSAVEWFAGALFEPALAVNEPVFRILNPASIGLTPNEDKLYSYANIFESMKIHRATIEQLSQTPPKEWSEDQKQLMQIWEQSILYAQILRSMGYLTPLEISVPTSLLKEWGIGTMGQHTISTLLLYEAKLRNKIGSIVKRKGSNPEKYNDREKEIAAFSFYLDTIKANSQGNIFFRVIPPHTGEEWKSPWTALQKNSAGDEELLQYWSSLAHAYQLNDIEKFASISQKMKAAYDPFVTTYKINLEQIYNALHPIGLSMLFYLGSFLLLAAYSMTDRTLFYLGSAGLLAVSAFVHILAISTRVVILSRPPVGTLYESILFVAAIVVLGALLIERQRKDGTGLLTGSVGGALLLFTSEGFASEDSLTMLVAVLNTNFWLATHVLCITIGYGLCLITSVLAHIYLYKMGTLKTSNLSPSIKTVGLMALLFTTVGTILGGIWADQSWGRFWGWDPKENGALLIVLWLAWAFHGHISGHLKNIAFTASMAILSVIVALAWFGVNLLNVGLHSYGFISGVAASLAFFCAFETAVIAYLWLRIKTAKAVTG